MLQAIIAISAGASIGAVLRWMFGTSLNAVWLTIPLGTLLANCVGGYLIGIAVTVFAHQPSLAPEWRLFVITGFLGGLTTFSTFSAEVMVLIQQGRLSWAFAAISAHVIGSLALTFLGIASANQFIQR